MVSGLPVVYHLVSRRGVRWMQMSGVSSRLFLRSHSIYIYLYIRAGTHASTRYKISKIASLERTLRFCFPVRMHQKMGPHCRNNVFGMSRGFRSLSWITQTNSSVCSNPAGNVCVCTLTVFAISPLCGIQKKHRYHKTASLRWKKKLHFNQMLNAA